MIKDLKIFVIFLLSFNIIKTDSDEDCSSFEDLKKAQCSNLGDGTKCFYDGENCKDKYEDCGSYTPTSETDKICSQITPKITVTADYYKKCAVEKDSGGSLTCKKVFKECEELTKEQCVSNLDIGLGSNKRCVFVGDKCELHYNSCTDDAIKDKQDLCKNNIPKDNKKKCQWQSSCSETDRKCSDFIEYSSYNENNAPCNELGHTSPKICFDNEDTCNEVYKSCEDYNSADTTITCTNIKPLKEIYSGSGYYIRDNLHKCVAGENNKCETKERICSDFKIQDDSESLCRELKSEKDDGSKSKASCILQEESCNDVYLKCEYYDQQVTDKAKRTENVCTSSIAVSEKIGYSGEHYKCSFKANDDNKCVTELKECNEITNSELCSKHTALLSDKEQQKCIYNGESCQKEFKNCDTYNNHFTDKSQISKTVCEAITPVYDAPDNVKKYICVYQEATSTTPKACKKQEIKKCEDYKGNDKTRCESLPVDDTSIYKCSLVDNKCVTQYKNCYAYNTDISKNNKEIYKSICESIAVSSDYYRCFLDDDKTCSYKKKICSDYEGEDEAECQNYRATNNNKVCSIENKKCVEKYPTITTQYYYCSEYRGTDKAFCESIQPYTYYSTYSSYFYPDYSFKCVYGEKGCEKIRKKCEEAKNENECQNITPFDKNKACVYNNGCIEQYKSCDSYNKQDTIEKTVCENILMQGYKCKYTAGTGNAKGTCTQEALKCSEFKLNLLGGICSNIGSSFTDKTKKCIFNNNACSLDDKTCLDLYDYNSANSEICQSTKTIVNDRKCVLNSGRCMEVMEEVEEVKVITEGEKSSGDNFVGKRYLIGFMFAILSLLV